MTNQSEIARIAAGLTEAQRDALVEGYGCGVQKGLLRLGLWKRARPNNNTDFKVTELGQAVRALLEQEQSK